MLDHLDHLPTLTTIVLTPIQNIIHKETAKFSEENGHFPLLTYSSPSSCSVALCDRSMSKHIFSWNYCILFWLISSIVKETFTARHLIFLTILHLKNSYLHRFTYFHCIFENNAHFKCYVILENWISCGTEFLVILSFISSYIISVEIYWKTLARTLFSLKLVSAIFHFFTKW